MSSKRKLIEDFPVVRPHPLSFAIASLIAAPAGTALAQDDGASGDILLEEVLVTARKRTENLQMVPESIQAISSQTIQQAGLRGMNDYVHLTCVFYWFQ